MREQEGQAVERVERGEHGGMLHNARNPHRGDDEKPDQHHRAEQVADRRSSPRLDSKQSEQDRDGGGHDIGLQRRGRHVQALQRRQHRDRRRDRAVAVDQRRPEQADRHDGRPLLLLHA
jgi:hypothetical protein